MDRDQPAAGWRIGFVVLAPFVAGYFLSYFFRNINAVIAPDLIRDIGLTASDLGLLTSAYFITFAAFQMPLGALLDRFGPRRVHASLLLLAAAGACVFALADSLALLFVARALIGLGVSGALMAALTAIVQWFPPARWPLINGLFMGLGGLGGLAATSPLEMALHVMDWRAVFLVLAAATVAVSAWIGFTVPDRPATAAPVPLGEQFRGYLVIARSREAWRITPIVCVIFVATLALQGLWLGPYLRDVSALDRDAAALSLLAVALGFAVGSPLVGLLAGRWKRRGGELPDLVAIGGLPYVLCLGAAALNLFGGATWFWFLFGLLTNVASLGYPIISGLFPPAFAGRANTAINMVMFISIFAMQNVMGRIIDFWPSPAPGHFATEGYAVNLWLLTGLAALSWAWLVFNRPRKPAA